MGHSHHATGCSSAPRSDPSRGVDEEATTAPRAPRGPRAGRLDAKAGRGGRPRASCSGRWTEACSPRPERAPRYGSGVAREGGESRHERGDVRFDRVQRVYRPPCRDAESCESEPQPRRRPGAGESEPVEERVHDDTEHRQPGALQELSVGRDQPVALAPGAISSQTVRSVRTAEERIRPRRRPVRAAPQENGEVQGRS